MFYFSPFLIRLPARYLSSVIGITVTLTIFGYAQDNSDEEAAVQTIGYGHSAHGVSYDVGPRQKPWEMDGIGSAPFEITTDNPEVQKWFNQGNSLLHSFWWFEAERAFRWCLKLEPNNAMAHWGLAYAATFQSQQDRAMDFMRKATRLKHTVSERERLFIEAWEALWLTDPTQPIPDTPETKKADYEAREKEHRKLLESLCLKYPRNVEVRAYLLLSTRDHRYASELIIREILDIDPRHPGAHHYRVHNWDYHEPEQALDSCELYGKLAFNIGHALHMPGHVYASLGMWHEAAIGMEAATRAEKRYMQESLTFPYDNWNYGHNLNFLSHLLEQLGMVELSMSSSRQLIDAPLDPTYNSDDLFSTHSSGIQALARAAVRFEHWDDLLSPDFIPWRDIPADQSLRTYVQARAQLAKGNLPEVELLMIEHGSVDSDKLAPWGKQAYDIQTLELRGRYLIAEGTVLSGLKSLSEAAEKQYVMQTEYADPPFYPEVIYTALGEVYIATDSPTLAVASFEKTLEISPHDLFALSGLVKAHAAIGDHAAAGDAMEQFLFITQDADDGLAVIEKAKATGIEASPRDYGVRSQRPFSSVSLDHFGPGKWEPNFAPKLNVHNAAGDVVSLEDYHGQNVILVFYLGEQCGHCMDQLNTLAKKQETWIAQDAVVLAVSSGALNPKDPGIIGSKGYGVLFMKDEDYANARRFHSYDDFEDMELHSTNLIDKEGRLYWARFGGDPFEDMDFIEKQLVRMNQRVGAYAEPLATDR